MVNMINEIIKQLNIDGKLIYLSQFGSHLYGLNTENSDLDFRGVYIPTLDDIILHKDKDEINEELEIYLPPEHLQQKEHVLGEIYMQPIVSEKGKQVNANRDNLKKVDVKIFSLQKFIQLCSKADTNALDLLFSFTNEEIEKYRPMKTINGEHKSIIRYIYENRNKLINTNRLESPITYAFKQATRFGIKGKRYSKILEILEVAKALAKEGGEYVRDLVQYFPFSDVIDDKHVKIDMLKNKDIDEYYLNVCGVQHQFNTSLEVFIQRIEEKINKEYTSERTKNAKDGNDWKSLSHAVRVLLEIQELMETGNIQFPLQHKNFLLDIKLGKVSRKLVDEFFKSHLSGLMECMEQDTLGWKYNEEFWNNFIIEESKMV